MAVEVFHAHTQTDNRTTGITMLIVRFPKSSLDFNET